MNGSNEKHSDPATVQTLPGDECASQRRLRLSDWERIESARAILESSHVDLVGFLDGDIREGPYFVVDSSDERDIQAATFTVYKLLHHYLAALYSFNEALRTTVTAYLPEDTELTKTHFTPEDGRQTEYTRRLMYLRGLRITAQHGAFNECFPVEQWDSASNEYRLGFDEATFSQHERIQRAGRICDTQMKSTSANRSNTSARFIQRISIRATMTVWRGSIRTDTNRVEPVSSAYTAITGFTILIARPRVLSV